MTKRILKSLLLISCFYSCFILAKTDNQKLLRQNYQLYQMWALSQNYFYGTTVPKDRVKALAWQLIYTSVLPKSYPGLVSIIDIYKKDLNDKEVKKAHQYAKKYRKEFDLEYRFNERTFTESFNLEKERLNSKPLTLKPFKNFDNFMQAVKKQNELLYKYYQDKLAFLNESKTELIAYGQVVVNGPEPAEGVGVSGLKHIDARGFFLESIKKPLIFELSGYESVYKSPDKEKGMVNFGRIVLNPLPKKKRASFVGNIYPKHLIKKVGIVLRLKSQQRKIAPWMMPVVPITFLGNGQFYATGLSPAEYQLVISYKGNVITKYYKLHAGAVKVVPSINIEREVSFF